MNARRGELAKQAVRTSMKVRASAGVDASSASCVWRICESLGVTVRFTRLNVEGLYIRTPDAPLILICSERPLARRVYTGGHELGHHVFGHGSTLDEMTAGVSPKDEEQLVDLFAGYLLMAPLAVRRAFAVRSLHPVNASPADLYTIACAFGVGYMTIIDHLAFTLGMLSVEQAKTLGRTTPKRLREQVLGIQTSGHLVIVDEHWTLPTIDVEVGDDVLLPAGAATSGEQVEEYAAPTGVRVRAKRPGIAQAFIGDQAIFIRVARRHYEGLLKYRHMADPEFTEGEVPDGCH